MEPQDLPRTLRRLDRGGWLEAARRFASSLRGAGHEPGRLLVVGTAQDEPWHLTAHLADTARWSDLPSLQPTLVRWRVPEGAPAHLATGIDTLTSTARGATLLVAAPHAADDQLLERLDDARRGGATLFALHPGAGPLDDLAHESLPLPPRMPAVPGFDAATHVISSAGALRSPRWRLGGGR